MSHDAPVCASCGGPLAPGDRFCGTCGTPAPTVSIDAGPRRRWPLILAAIAAAVVAGVVAVVVLVSSGIPDDTAATVPVDAPEASRSPVPDPAASASPSPTPTPEPTVGASFAGQWAGDILGDSHPYTVQVTMTETDGVVSGTAVYPEIPCEGTWAQSSRVGSTAIVIETMPTTNVCYDQVAITLILAADGTVSYTAQSGPYLITSTLTRMG